MRDLKHLKAPKVRANRRRRPPREPRDWKKVFQRLFSLGLFAGSAALVLLVAGGILMIGRLFMESRIFRVETIRIEHNRQVASDEIRERSDIQVGMNIFRLDLELIGRQIDEHPWISSARVKRVFPREVVIQVTEHIPAALINLGGLYYVDRDGIVFKPLEKGDRLDLPLLTGLDQLYLLEHPAEARRLLQEALTVVRALGERGVFGLAQISEVHLDPVEGFDLYTLSGGIPVRLGFGGYAEKLQRLERVYGQLAPRLAVLKYIDLNVDDRVIVKYDGSLTSKEDEDSAKRGRT